MYSLLGGFDQQSTFTSNPNWNNSIEAAVLLYLCYQQLYSSVPHLINTFETSQEWTVKCFYWMCISKFFFLSLSPVMVESNFHCGTTRTLLIRNSVVLWCTQILDFIWSFSTWQRGWGVGWGRQQNSNLLFLRPHHTFPGSSIAIFLTHQFSMCSPYFSLHMTGSPVLTRISTFPNLLILFPHLLLFSCVSPLFVPHCTCIFPQFCVLFFLQPCMNQRLSCLSASPWLSCLCLCLLFQKPYWSQ